MSLRFFRMSLLLALSLVGQTYAQAPRELGALSANGGEIPAISASSENQKTASAIAARIKSSDQLRNYRVEVSYQDQIATLTGTVSNQSQKDEVIRLVEGMSQVAKVIDQISIQGSVQQVQAQTNPGTKELPTLPDAPSLEGPRGPMGGGDVDGGIAPPGGVNGPMGAPMNPMNQEPVPIFSAPPPNGAELNAPRMPPYAWPTYAPYNNYSRVAYPLSYPYNAFPYIGPFYPFPKVPPGWRSVKLEWDDGYWWFSKHSNRYDWWRLRFH